LWEEEGKATIRTVRIISRSSCALPSPFRSASPPQAHHHHTSYEHRDLLTSRPSGLQESTAHHSYSVHNTVAQFAAHPRCTHIITIRTTDIRVFILAVHQAFEKAQHISFLQKITTILQRIRTTTAQTTSSPPHQAQLPKHPRTPRPQHGLQIENVLHHPLNLFLPRGSLRPNPAHPLRALQPRHDTQHGTHPLSQPHEATTDKRWQGMWEM
jgi:hypothetical protein